MTAIHILVQAPSNKLNYVFDFVFKHRLGLDYFVTSGQQAIESSHSIASLNYTSETFDSLISINYSPYLLEFNQDSIPNIEPELTFLDGKSNFDLFAAIFFLLARVEEYGSKKVDEHGRYLSSASQLSINGLLEIPIIDIWVTSFANHLEAVYDITIKKPSYTATSTIDIDHIYAYRGKPLWLSLASLTRDVLTLQGNKVKARLEQDPFDTYQEMIKANEANGYDPIFFILTAARSQFDKSLPPTHPLFRGKVKELCANQKLGIHPSYASNEDPRLLANEINTLSKLTTHSVTQSRQHYLKLTIPETYRRLLANGIQEDHSMGYADRIGFRAGTSHPFFWYDIENDRTTTLKVVPFCLMDVTLRKYMNLQPEEAIDLLTELINQLKAIGGHCSFIWHNSSFYDAEGWKGWGKVYAQLLQIARP